MSRTMLRSTMFTPISGSKTSRRLSIILFLSGINFPLMCFPDRVLGVGLLFTVSSVNAFPTAHFSRQLHKTSVVEDADRLDHVSVGEDEAGSERFWAD